MSEFEDAEFLPLAGDPSVVSRQAAGIESVAAAIAEAVTTLRKVQNLEGMAGQAVTKLAGKAREVADDISRAKERYAAAGQALAAYGVALEAAQSQARTAIWHIDELTPQLAGASDRAQVAADAYRSSAGAADSDQALSDALQAQRYAQALQEQLQPWQSYWRSAAGDKKASADAAAGRIAHFTADGADGLNNHWYDGVASFGESVWDSANDFLKSELFGFFLTFIDDELTVLSIGAAVLAFIPGVDVADLGLGAGIAALGILSAAGHVARDAAQGDGNAAAVDAAVGVVSIFGGGAMRAIAKLGVKEAPTAVKAVVESGELEAGIRQASDLGERAVSLIGKLKAGLTDVGQRIGATWKRVRDLASKAWGTASEIGSEGWTDLRRGKYGFVSVAKLKGASEAAGFGREVTEALGAPDQVGRAVTIGLLSATSIAARGLELVKGTAELITENVETFGRMVGGEEGAQPG